MFRKKASRAIGNKGFTLLELILVLVILSISAAMIFPKLSSFGAGNLKRTARHLSGLIQYLAQESAATKQVYRLHYDLEQASYWVDTLQDNREFAAANDPLLGRRKLPSGIRFEDVITARHGKVNEGEVYTEIFHLGVEKTAIHLQEDERIWTLAVNPFTGRVKVYDRYVE